jgi:hypothetical protein
MSRLLNKVVSRDGWYNKNSNFEKNLAKLERIIYRSMAWNKHKKNYNAAAVMLMARVKPRVNNGTIKGNQKERFRGLYNKFASVVNHTAVSMNAKKILNNVNLMKRYYNRRNNPLGAAPFLGTKAPSQTAFRKPVAPTPVRVVAPTPVRVAPVPLNRRGRPMYRMPPPPSGRPAPPSVTRSCVLKKIGPFGQPICK